MTDEQLADAIMRECYDIESLEQESRLPVPPPEHSNYSNGCPYAAPQSVRE